MVIEFGVLSTVLHRKYLGEIFDTCIIKVICYNLQQVSVMDFYEYRLQEDIYTFISNSLFMYRSSLVRKDNFRVL